MLYSALSNFGQGDCRVRAKRYMFSLMEGSKNYGIVGHSPPSPALHDNSTRQLSKYIAGTRQLSFPLAAIISGLGGGHADTQVP